MLFLLFTNVHFIAMKKIIVILFAFLIPLIGITCTTAVISGKYTKDGRPMIWKLRDSDSFKNKMMYFKEGKYAFIGLVNSEDAQGEQVWGGSNVVGFSIMNSASFNVNMGDTTSFKDQEGYFMRKALENCETIEDFEILLAETPKPMGLAAHFGVIDAAGGAAFYEVNNYTFTKFDANEASQAPQGYILRTNFSFTGQKDIGYGFIRFQTAQALFYQAESKGQLNDKTIVQYFSHCFKHAVLDKDFRKEYEVIPEGEYFINSGDFITRHGSASAILMKAPTKDQAPDMTCIWTTIAYPNTCVALPVWPRGGAQMPSILMAEDDQNCDLNDWAMQLKEECYPISRSAGYKYLQISKLINAEQQGITQLLENLEDDIFNMTNEKESLWLDKSPDKSEIQDYYQSLNNKVSQFYQNNFNLN